MSILDACGAAITGLWDHFDQAIAVVEWVEEKVKEADEGAIEKHGDGLFVGEHLCDVTATRLSRLKEATALVRQAELITQEVLAEV